MNRDHAFVVVGLGSVGSAALYWLARMAAPYASVLGLERGAAGNARADRTGAVAYARSRGAHAALAPAAHQAWRQVECLSGQKLVTRTGGLVIEDPAVPAARGAVDRHLAVAARHGIPFYVVAPLSTLDPQTPSGDAIPIEERDPGEVTEVLGTPVAPPGSQALNLAFDVTPAELVTAIVTEAGVLEPPYEEAIARVAAR